MTLDRRVPLWRLTLARRRLFEMTGSRRYSRPSRGGIADTIHQLVPRAGNFVEAGAVDGFFESNTYELETFHNWRGVLIEPVPEMFCRIATTRPLAKAVNCALVGRDFADDTIEIETAHALSRVVHGNAGVDDSALRKVRVPARTLTEVIEDAELGTIDLLSLDVEGFETEVIKGLDMTRHRPTYIVVECLSDSAFRAVTSLLQECYEILDRVTDRDVLFKAIP